MARNIIIAVQQEMHLMPLEKIDPNKDQAEMGKNRLVQASLPAVLAGMFHATRTKEGSLRLMNAGEASWLNRIFDKQAEELVDKVAHYAECDKSSSAELMESAADTAYTLLQASKEGGLDAEGLKEALSQQRHEILVYLPPSLDMGHLLNDPTLDDRTNKMEGPISNMMHKIEDKFSGG